MIALVEAVQDREWEIVQDLEQEWMDLEWDQVVWKEGCLIRLV